MPLAQKRSTHISNNDRDLSDRKRKRVQKDTCQSSFDAEEEDKNENESVDENSDIDDNVSELDQHYQWPRSKLKDGVR